MYSFVHFFLESLTCLYGDIQCCKHSFRCLPRVTSHYPIPRGVVAITSRLPVLPDSLWTLQRLYFHFTITRSCDMLYLKRPSPCKGAPQGHKLIYFSFRKWSRGWGALKVVGDSYWQPESKCAGDWTWSSTGARTPWCSASSCTCPCRRCSVSVTDSKANGFK